MLKAFDREALGEHVLKRLDHKPLRRVESRLNELLAALIAYDAHFMRLTGVLADNDQWGDGEYDEDDAFEYIYDAYLADDADDDDDMAVASLLNQYMALKEQYYDL